MCLFYTGRAIAVAASGLIDLRDDAEGLDAGIEIERYVGGEVKGYVQTLLGIFSPTDPKSQEQG